MHFLAASVILPQSRGYEVRIEGKVELSHQYSFLIKIYFTNSSSHELSGVSYILAYECSSVCSELVFSFY